jgi:hypothetical protein
VFDDINGNKLAPSGDEQDPWIIINIIQGLLEKFSG